MVPGQKLDLSWPGTISTAKAASVPHGAGAVSFSGLMALKTSSLLCTPLSSALRIFLF